MILSNFKRNSLHFDNRKYNINTRHTNLSNKENRIEAMYGFILSLTKHIFFYIENSKITYYNPIT